MTMLTGYAPKQLAGGGKEIDKTIRHAVRDYENVALCGAAVELKGASFFDSAPAIACQMCRQLAALDG